MARYCSFYDTPLCRVGMSSDGTFLTGLWFENQRFSEEKEKLASDNENINDELDIFKKTKEWLDIYFSGKEPDFTPPLKMETTDFRKAVWEVMLTIPYGKTMTYGDIAKILEKKKGIRKMSAQAVGGAVGHNDIAIIIPCHRVMGAGGNLTGYGGGIEKKIKLLEIEGAFDSSMYVPKKGNKL